MQKKLMCHFKTSPHLQLSQFFTGVSCQLLNLDQADIHVSQPNCKLLPLRIKLLPL